MINTTDYSNECDYTNLKNRIADVLRTYFETDDNGEPNKKFDPDFTAQEAIDQIHEIIGDI